MSSAARSSSDTGVKRSHPLRPWLFPLAAGFRLGVALRREAYRRGWLDVHRLRHPVVSVGNLTVGGSGKTPLVITLAERLRLHGRKPAILTRGYKRSSADDLVVLDPSREGADAATCGDEAAMMARACPTVPIIISADRYRAGRVAEERFGADVHLLDDGFQHLALARELDIVALDVTQKVFEDRLLPAGHLREPVEALERADVVVLTRTELADAARTEESVRRVNPKARVFRARTELSEIVQLHRESPLSDEAWKAQRVAAFCGLGNPESFFENLRLWGFNVVAKATVRDHHRYSEGDIAYFEQLARGSRATALVTTEKDAMNLPPAARISLPVFVCRVRLEILEAESFDHEILSRLEKSYRDR